MEKLRRKKQKTENQMKAAASQQLRHGEGQPEAGRPPK